MASRIQKNRSKIIEALSLFAVRVGMSNNLNQQDINICAENFFRDIFNYIYSDRKFININEEEKNSTAIDVGDNINDIAYQITSTTSRSKVISTISKFKNKAQYAELRMLYCCMKKPKRKNNFENEINNAFKFKEFDLNDLVNLICNLEGNNLNKVANYIYDEVFPSKEEKLTDISVDYSFDYFIKGLKKLDAKQFIPRKLKATSPVEENDIISGFGLTSLIESKNKIVILSSAGMGKTEELKQLAFKFAEEKIKTPIFGSFSNYTIDKNIEDFIHKEWKNIPSDKVVIIFDGFDELIEADINTAKRKLQCFIDDYPKISIIISCRTNFYHIAINGNSETLPGFTAYYLEPLTESDIIDYTSNIYKINGEEFLNTVYEKQFEDLVFNPFFLKVLIKYYIQYNKSLGNRINLFHYLINERLSWDKEHFSTSFMLNDEEENVLTLLRRVSFAMTLLGTKSLSTKEFKNIISSPSEFDLIKHSTVFNKGGKNEEWKYEHKNFQEILCAEFLLELSAEDIIKIISYDEYPKIKPSWLNVVSFLISLLKEENLLFNEVIGWIVENDHEVLVKVEKERISIKMRTDIFIKVFNYYKEKNIWLNSNHFTLNDLISFGESEETINFSFEEVLNLKNPRRVRYNALMLIERFSYNNTIETDSLKEKLFTLLESDVSDKNFVFGIIHAIKQLGYTNKETIDRLLSLIGESHNAYIRSGMYFIINTGLCVEDYIDYYLEGIDIYTHKAGTYYEDREEINLLDEGHNLFDGIALIKTSKGLSKVIENYIKNADELDYKYDFKQIFDLLINNCIEAYTIDDTIFHSILLLLMSQSKFFRRERFGQTFKFLEVTKTIKKAFDETLLKITEEEESRTHLSYFLSDVIETENDLDKIIDLYLSNKISKEKITGIFWDMRMRKKDMSDKFLSKIEKHTDIKIEIPEYVDYNLITKKRTQESFNLLFDIDKFKTEALKIFENKEELNKNDLYTYRVNANKNIEDIFYESALNLLRDLSNNEIIYKKDVSNWFKSSGKIFNYQISSIYLYLKNRKDTITVSPEQTKVIKTWWDRTINNIDFTTAIKIKDGNNFTVEYNAIWASFFLKEFNFKCSDNILLDMLSFTAFDEFVSFDWLCEELPKEVIEPRIISNIRDNRLKNDSVYVKHAKYIFQNKLKEGYSLIIRDLCGNSLESHSKTSIIESYFEEELNIEAIKEVLNKMNLELQITILKKLIKKEDLAFVIPRLEKLHEQNLNKLDEKDINNLLVSCHEINGLVYSIKWIEKYQESPFSQHGQGLYYFSDIKALPHLMTLLRMAYNTSLKVEHELDRMLPLVNDGLKFLAIQSQENFKRVCQEIETFIKDNKDTLDEVEFLNSTIERIKEVFFQNYNPQTSIKEVGAILKKLSI